jgi:hypothetical protein
MSIALRITVEGTPVAPDIKVAFQKDMNVQQVLEAAYNEQLAYEKVLRFSAEYLGSELGYELTALDGISMQIGADGNTFFFWELSINGTYSPTGMDQTQPKDGDVIEWNFTSYSEDRHAGTRHEKIRSLRSN